MTALFRWGFRQFRSELDHPHHRFWHRLRSGLIGALLLILIF